METIWDKEGNMPNKIKSNKTPAPKSHQDNQLRRMQYSNIIA